VNSTDHLGPHYAVLPTIIYLFLFRTKYPHIKLFSNTPILQFHRSIITPK